MGKEICVDLLIEWSNIANKQIYISQYNFMMASDEFQGANCLSSFMHYKFSQGEEE